MAKRQKRDLENADELDDDDNDDEKDWEYLYPHALLARIVKLHPEWKAKKVCRYMAKLLRKKKYRQTAEYMVSFLAPDALSEVYYPDFLDNKLGEGHRALKRLIGMAEKIRS